MYQTTQIVFLWLMHHVTATAAVGKISIPPAETCLQITVWGSVDDKWLRAPGAGQPLRL